MFIYFLFLCLICRLFTHRSKAVKMHLLPFCKQATQLISERPLCQCVWNEDTHLRASRALPKAWNEIKITHTHKHTHLEPEHKASCWVNKENRQRVRVREHKQNSAKLLFAFHISGLRSRAAALALCISNTMLFIATLILWFVGTALN